MKKNKFPDRSAPEFNNNPFKSLKSLKPKINPRTTQTKKPETPAKKESHESDEDMFLRAVSGVRSTNPSQKEQSTEEKEHKGTGVPGTAQQNDSSLFLEAMQKIGATFQDHSESYAEERPRQSASSRMKQLKRGTIRIRQELDLHGCLKEEALVKLAHFIAAASGRSHKAVLVITGKGLNSAEGPVLQGAVSAWLHENGEGFVAEFYPAPRELGGSGAFVVFLKNR